MLYTAINFCRKEGVMSKTQRIVITLPYDMYLALKKLAEDNSRPMAEEARLGIESHLHKHGRKVSGTIAWGGPRADQDIDEGQQAAVVAL
jgi:hypothetical protein